MEEKTFSQAELNSIVSDRLNKEKEKYEKAIAELNSKTAEYEKQIAVFTDQAKANAEKMELHAKEISERDAKIKGYEQAALKMRVAHEVGIPYELAGRLSGETEEDIKKDAESIKGYLGSTKPVPPLRDAEDASGSSLDMAYRTLARG